MKLFVWCLTVLTSFSLVMLVMFVFNYPYENYGNETKEMVLLQSFKSTIK